MRGIQLKYTNLREGRVSFEEKRRESLQAPKRTRLNGKTGRGEITASGEPPLKGIQCLFVALSKKKQKGKGRKR